jgi:diketogulonate reductase-like aldo/keto reductase
LQASDCSALASTDAQMRQSVAPDTPNGAACVNAVRWALDLGYRHIDTAQAR